ncbi:hypothetical protein GCM10007082_04660 [Oceanisphaera arctica]|nr:hypothetical protein GCM10007082_04660 [Oceanisphaera arctica]
MDLPFTVFNIGMLTEPADHQPILLGAELAVIYGVCRLALQAATVIITDPSRLAFAEFSSLGHDILEPAFIAGYDTLSR